MDGNNYKCRKCKKEYEEKLTHRQVCRECLKAQRHNYYSNNKDRFPNKYIKTNIPRGRPKKEKDKDIDKVNINSE